MKTKKIPLRQCLGCREMKPKKELLRIVRTATGEIRIDHTGKLAGRGAYVCKDISCLEKSIKTKALSRAFDMPVGQEVFLALREELNGPDAEQK